MGERTGQPASTPPAPLPARPSFLPPPPHSLDLDLERVLDLDLGDHERDLRWYCSLSITSPSGPPSPLSPEPFSGLGGDRDTLFSGLRDLLLLPDRDLDLDLEREYLLCDLDLERDLDRDLDRRRLLLDRDLERDLDLDEYLRCLLRCGGVSGRP